MFTVGPFRAAAVTDGQHVVAAGDDSLGQQKPLCQFDIRSGVRMVTVSGVPFTRISSGSSTTSVSGRSVAVRRRGD